MNLRSLMISIPVVIFVSTSAFANEGGGGHEVPAEEHGGEKAEGGGSHGEPKTVMAPWVEVENKIQELYSKIKSKESIVKELLEEKDHLPNNSPQLQHAVKQVVVEHKELRRLVEEYQKQVSILKYRFPERNAKQVRSYERFEVKTIDEMEAALGIDGKLTRNMKKMRRQYKPDEVHPETREPASAPHVKAPPKEQSIEEANSVILQK
jgi:hypothetical protein